MAKSENKKENSSEIVDVLTDSIKLKLDKLDALNRDISKLEKELGIGIEGD